MSTDSFVPLSHDNTYLFNHYDKIPNFIKARLGHKYANILAKPVQRNYNIEWFSPFSGLKDISKSKEDAALRQYFEFQDVLKTQLEQLSTSTDADTRNWASLLEKVFDKESNIIYSNGKDISVIWGWAFENNTIHRPAFADLKQEEKPTIEEAAETVETPIGNNLVDTPIEEKVTEPPIEETEPDINEPEDEIEDVFIFEEEETEEELIEPEKKGFLEFLKEFAARYWWWLVVLLVLCVLVFLVKSLIYH